ncbi:MAG: TonB-dependent receptor [Melioribacteraceae bacterium]|nr:TonB-dependent receptor [Melioribacteraceae bacterium]
MKKLITLFIISCSLHAQQSEGQSIELPDFVITGVQSISIPEMEKQKPDLIQSLSEEFFTPHFLPHELNLKDYSTPNGIDYNIFRQLEYNTGTLILGAGNNTLPAGHLYFNQNYNQFLLNTHLWGSNTTEYIKNAGYNESGLSASADIFTNSSSSFLPGLKINFNGLYFRDNYKLYASSDPGYKRQKEGYKSEISISSLVSDRIKYGMDGSYEGIKFRDTNFKEEVIKAGGFAKLNFGKFGVEVKGGYQKQHLRNTFLPLRDYDYIFTNADLLFGFIDIMNFKIGAFYSKLGNTEFFSPTASVDIKIDEGILLFAEYDPRTEFFNVNDILNDNRYFEPLFRNNVLKKVESHIMLALKYDYSELIEISVGADYKQVDNQPYYNDSVNKGIFNIITLNDIEHLRFFSHLIIHKNRFGYLIADIYYNDIEDKNDKTVPYVPDLEISAAYNFIPFGRIEFIPALFYVGRQYIDAANTINLSPYIDLSLTAKYQMFSGFKIWIELNNILNRSNFLFNGYQEKTFDIIAGIDYRW